MERVNFSVLSYFKEKHYINNYHYYYKSQIDIFFWGGPQYYMLIFSTLHKFISDWSEFKLCFYVLLHTSKYIFCYILVYRPYNSGCKAIENYLIKSKDIYLNVVFLRTVSYLISIKHKYYDSGMNAVLNNSFLVTSAFS